MGIAYGDSGCGQVEWGSCAQILAPFFQHPAKALSSTQSTIAQSSRPREEMVDRCKMQDVHMTWSGPLGISGPRGGGEIIGRRGTPPQF